MWTVCTRSCLALHATCRRQQQQQQEEEQEKPIIANELECGSAKMSTSDKAADKAAGPVAGTGKEPPTPSPAPYTLLSFPCPLPTEQDCGGCSQSARGALSWSELSRMRSELKWTCDKEGARESSRRESERERGRGRPLRAKNALLQRAGLLKYLARRLNSLGSATARAVQSL